MKTIYPVGLAKDGNIIYGPYYSDGSIWDPKSLDACNGAFIKDG